MIGKKSIVRQFDFTTQYSPKSTQNSSSEKNKCYSDPYDSLTDPHYDEALKALTMVNSNAQDLGNEITALIDKNLTLKEKLTLLAIEKDTLVVQNDFMKESLNKEIALLKQQVNKAKQKSKQSSCLASLAKQRNTANRLKNFLKEARQLYVLALLLISSHLSQSHIAKANRTLFAILNTNLSVRQ